jgi:hypothetical protein
MLVSEWMTDVAGPQLAAREQLVADVESGITSTKPGVPETIPQALEDAATKAVQTVSSLAKVADQAVRDSARRIATKAARDVGSIATALKVPIQIPGTGEIAKANERLKAALAPLVAKAKPESVKKAESSPTSGAEADPEATRASRPPKS